jgi:hypothetical protein
VEAGKQRPLLTFDEGELAERGVYLRQDGVSDMKIEFISLIGNLGGGDPAHRQYSRRLYGGNLAFQYGVPASRGPFHLFVCIIAAYFISKQFSRRADRD